MDEKDIKHLIGALESISDIAQNMIREIDDPDIDVTKKLYQHTLKVIGGMAVTALEEVRGKPVVVEGSKAESGGNTLCLEWKNNNS